MRHAHTLTHFRSVRVFPPHNVHCPWQGKALRRQLLLKDASQQLLQSPACPASLSQRLQDLHQGTANFWWRSITVWSSDLDFAELKLAKQYQFTKPGDASVVSKGKRCKRERCTYGRTDVSVNTQTYIQTDTAPVFFILSGLSLLPFSFIYFSSFVLSCEGFKALPNTTFKWYYLQEKYPSLLGWIRLKTPIYINGISPLPRITPFSRQ